MDDARKLKVTAIQLTTRSEDKAKNLGEICGLIDEAAKDKPDLIVLPELCATPYWCAHTDNRYFDWAEPVPGPTTALIGERARAHGCAIVVPLFERGRAEGEYYNSAAVLGPDGSLVEGATSDGETFRCYRKVHLPVLERPPVHLDEKYYFRPGGGFPVFRLGQATIGLLICWDRCFPEGWRALALQGAELIVMSSALLSWEPGAGVSRSEQFMSEMRTRALENQVFVTGCNKCGAEAFGGIETRFFGQSCFIDPFGSVMTVASQAEPALVTETLDLGKIREARLTLPFYHDRRPELYGVLTERR